MTIHGLQTTHIQQNGKKCREIFAIVLLLLFCTAIFCGCGISDGVYHLTKEYYIIRVNANCIRLATLSNPELDTYSTYISNFYITNFCYNDRYIGLIGVATEEAFASDEEKEQNARIYYLVDSNYGVVYGPFQTKAEYLDQCDALEIAEVGEWLKPQDVI